MRRISRVHFLTDILDVPLNRARRDLDALRNLLGRIAGRDELKNLLLTNREKRLSVDRRSHCFRPPVTESSRTVPDGEPSF
jgi:hypothetical protein